MLPQVHAASESHPVVLILLDDVYLFCSMVLENIVKTEFETDEDPSGKWNGIEAESLSGRILILKIWALYSAYKCVR